MVPHLGGEIMDVGVRLQKVMEAQAPSSSLVQLMV